jgi:hypothetical protein
MSARDNILQPPARRATRQRRRWHPAVPAFYAAIRAATPAQHARGENRTVLRKNGVLAR